MGAIDLRELGARVLKQISTTSDNQTFALARLMAIAIIPAYILMGMRSLAVSTAEHPFDFQAYGAGFGLILVALSAFILAEEHGVPAPKKETP